MYCYYHIWNAYIESGISFNSSPSVWNHYNHHFTMTPVLMFINPYLTSTNEQNINRMQSIFALLMWKTAPVNSYIFIADGLVHNLHLCVRWSEIWKVAPKITFSGMWEFRFQSDFRLFALHKTPYICRLLMHWKAHLFKHFRLFETFFFGQTLSHSCILMFSLPPPHPPQEMKASLAREQGEVDQLQQGYKMALGNYQRAKKDMEDQRRQVLLKQSMAQNQQNEKIK